MKSNKARALVKEMEKDYNAHNKMINSTVAHQAVQVAEQELTEKAIEAYKQCCQYYVNGDCEYGEVSSPCRMRCLTCAQFIKHLK